MNRTLMLIGAIAAGAFASQSSLAQNETITTTETLRREVIQIPPEQEMLVREYVMRGPGEPVIVEGGGRVRPGSVIPEWVDLQPFSGLSVPALRGYGFFVSPDEKIVIVDPATRVVVRILSM